MYTTPVEEMDAAAIRAELRERTRRVPDGYQHWSYDQVVDYKKHAKKAQKYLARSNSDLHLLRPALKALRTFG